MGVDPWVDRGTCPPILFKVEGTPLFYKKAVLLQGYHAIPRVSYSLHLYSTRNFGMIPSEQMLVCH